MVPLACLERFQNINDSWINLIYTIWDFSCAMQKFLSHNIFPFSLLTAAFLFVSLWINQAKMARGQQKIQSQQKKAEKNAKLKKQAGSDQKKSAAKALIFTCTVCKVIPWTKLLSGPNFRELLKHKILLKRKNPCL